MHRPDKEILAIIPARIGSTAVKNKNIREIGKKPLIFYTIKASLESIVNRTIVSTDSPKIKNISEKLGAEVPFIRPKKFSHSRASSLSVVIHCLNYLKKYEQYSPDYVVYLQPTSPFRTSQDINNGIKTIIKTKTNSLVGIVKVDQHPYWMFKKEKNILSELICLKNKPLRRQELPTLFYINDALCITKISYLKSAKDPNPIFDQKNISGFEMSLQNSFDINSEFDLKIAQQIFSLTKFKK